jgi:hypothetical protein
MFGKIKVFVVAVLSVFLLALSPVQASSLKNLGWQQQDGSGHYMVNTGMDGGLLKLGCDKPGDTLQVSYAPAGEGPSELFIIEVPAHGDVDTRVNVSAYGLMSLSPKGVLDQMERTNEGLLVSHYPKGSVSNFFSARNQPGEYQVPVPVGSEEFVGMEDVHKYVKRMREVCTGHYEDPIL